MKLPLLISVPHAGLDIPNEVASLNLLTEKQIIKDGDEGAAEIFAFENDVIGFVTTNIARAFVDVNRAIDDRQIDGVVKSHTIWREPIYRNPLPENIVTVLLDKYYDPYHSRLTKSVRDVKLGIDCHTMVEVAPTISTCPGTERPLICLSNADGTCPKRWFEVMTDCLSDSFDCVVSCNEPFQGGYIIRNHAAELPWMQLELSRVLPMSYDERRHCVLQAFRRWCRRLN